MAKDSDKVRRNEAKLVHNTLCSDSSLVSKEELRRVLKTYNYFKQ